MSSPGKSTARNTQIRILVGKIMIIWFLKIPNWLIFPKSKFRVWICGARNPDPVNHQEWHWTSLSDRVRVWICCVRNPDPGNQPLETLKTRYCFGKWCYMILKRSNWQIFSKSKFRVWISGARIPDPFPPKIYLHILHRMWSIWHFRAPWFDITGVSANGFSEPKRSCGKVLLMSAIQIFRAL